MIFLQNAPVVTQFLLLSLFVYITLFLQFLKSNGHFIWISTTIKISDTSLLNENKAVVRLHSPVQQIALVFELPSNA